jgi:O-antigen/teichoic acid export membrane protein
VCSSDLLLRFGGSLTTNRVLWYFTTQADVFIAGRLLGSQLLGLYAVAANLAALPMQKLMAVSNQVAFSAFAKLQNDRPALLDGLQSSLAVLLAIATGVLWAMAGVATDLIPWLLGAKWSQAVPLLQMIAVIVPLRIAASTLSTAIIATGHVGTDLRNTMLSATIMVPAFALGAHLGGVQGLALAWVLGYPLYALVLFTRARSVLGFGFRRLARAGAAPVAAGISMLAVIFGLSTWLSAARPELRMAVQCAAGAAVYLGVLAAVDRSLIGHARSLLGLDRASH